MNDDIILAPLTMEAAKAVLVKVEKPGSKLCFALSREAMPHVFDGRTSQSVCGPFAIVVSRYNESITGKLLAGALETLTTAGVPMKQIHVAWVPGAWEIPLVAQQFAKRREYQAVICLGAVIKGETSHDQHINRYVSLALGDLALKHEIPVLFGILTCNSLEQAIHRSGGNVGNKGVECAEAALELVRLLNQIPPDELSS